MPLTRIRLRKADSTARRWLWDRSPVPGLTLEIDGNRVQLTGISDLSSGAVDLNHMPPEPLQSDLLGVLRRRLNGICNAGQALPIGTREIDLHGHRAKTLILQK